MQRAGLAIAQLALAVAPHARHVWVACGPGNNGGDGFEAALQLHALGKPVTVGWLGDETRAPADAWAAYRRAIAAGVTVTEHPPAQWDLCIDALLGLGFTGVPSERMQGWISRIIAPGAPVLAVDLPSGLQADTGTVSGYVSGYSATISIATGQPNRLASDSFHLNSTDATGVRARGTLCLLSLKPSLFTAQGRDRAGEVWLDVLGVDLQNIGRDTPPAPCARLQGPPQLRPRAHAAHNGNCGDVAVVGGASGMTGAALLAASAALHAGAGVCRPAGRRCARRGHQPAGIAIPSRGFTD